MGYRHLMLMKLLVILISNITASKETSGSQMPCPMLGNITHTPPTPPCLTLSFDFFGLLYFGFVLRRSLQELVRKLLTLSVLMLETMLMIYCNLDCLLGRTDVNLITYWDWQRTLFLMRNLHVEKSCHLNARRRFYTFSNGDKRFANVDQEMTKFTVGVAL